MSKEEIRRIVKNMRNMSGLQMDAVANRIDEYAKQRAVEFFKWNALKAAEYLDYLRRVDKAEGWNEKEKELDYFEGATIATRYELFSQEIERQSLNK